MLEQIILVSITFGVAGFLIWYGEKTIKRISNEPIHKGDQKMILKILKAKASVAF